jgi:hypothetical protein
MKIVTNKARIWSTETITTDGGDVITIVGIEDGDDEMTDKEIIKAAKYCAGCVRQCDDCKLHEDHDCTNEFAKYIVNHNPTTITQEAAIDRLRELGWLQKHDKELTELNIRIGYDAAIIERADLAEIIEQVRKEHKRNTKPEWAIRLYDKFMESN